MQHDDYRELVALDAIGALGPEDASALAGHLASCVHCEREAEELRDAAAALAYTVEAVKPPAYLRDRVLQSTRAADSVLPFKKTARSAEGNGAGDSAVRPAGRDSSRADRTGTWRLLSSRPPLMFGSIAAAVLIALLATTSVLMWARNRELSSELARLSENLQRAQGELLLARREANRSAEVLEIVTSAAPMTLLAGTEAAPGATARLVVDQRTGQAVLAAHGLPPAPAGKAYQLWYIAGKTPQPGAVFKTDPTGRAVLTDRVPEAGLAAKLFAVTLEPEGGVQSPTGGMYLKGTS